MPIDGTIKITQYNLFETEVTTYETTSIGADGKPILGYKEKYGIHGEIILWQSKSRFGQFQSVARVTSLVGKKLIFQSPYSIEDDHPGDLESIILRGKGKRLSYFKSSMKGPKDAGKNRTDKGLNRKFKGKLFTVTYKYRDNYDPETST